MSLDLNSIMQALGRSGQRGLGGMSGMGGMNPRDANAMARAQALVPNDGPGSVASLSRTFRFGMPYVGQSGSPTMINEALKVVGMSIDPKSGGIVDVSQYGMQGGINSLQNAMMGFPSFSSAGMMGMGGSPYGNSLGMGTSGYPSFGNASGMNRSSNSLLGSGQNMLTSMFGSTMTNAMGFGNTQNALNASDGILQSAIQMAGPGSLPAQLAQQAQQAQQRERQEAMMQQQQQMMMQRMQMQQMMMPQRGGFSGGGFGQTQASGNGMNDLITKLLLQKLLGDDSDLDLSSLLGGGDGDESGADLSSLLGDLDLEGLDLDGLDLSDLLG